MGDGHFGGEILDGVGVNRLIIRDQRVNPRARTPFSGEAQILGFYRIHDETGSYLFPDTWQELDF